MAAVPATRKGQLTRERIVRAGAELVADRGAAGVSLDDVQARSGVSRSQLYHYFDDRDDLIRAVVGATTSTVLDTQGELLDHLDTWAGIDRWFDALVALQVERRARGGCPLGSLAGQLAERDPDARRAIAEGLDRWEGRLRQGLERMKSRGVLSPGADPRPAGHGHDGQRPGRVAADAGSARPAAAPHRPRCGAAPSGLSKTAAVTSPDR
jgi:TetR/AcrR family transcriptional regulator, transcriptional repressor for nem operon